MAPKKRNSNNHLPPRVYFKHGAYYFVNRSNQWIWLGRSLSESMKRWSELVDRLDSKIHTMNQLFNRYMAEVAPLKSEKSYKGNIVQMSPLRLWFGDMDPEEVTPVDIYKYLDKRALKAPVSANREKALLSHVYSMAIRWGVVRDNPCRNVKRLPESPRKRYIEDKEYLAVYSIAPEIIRLIMDFAYLTGQRIGDILKIKINDLTEDGIKIEQSKTKTKLLIQWSEELTNCVEKIKRLPRSVLYSLTLFCNRRGSPLTYDGFSTIWSRVMKKAIGNGDLKETFTFHDIRAKSSSDAKNRQQASELLGHADIRITERVYNRKHKKVSPIR